MKINIIGTSGSGKSTFSKQIAQKLNIPHIELDALFWKENWTPSSDQEFFTKIEKAINCENWVLDGNYDRTQYIKWEKVDKIIFLDLPFYLVLFRIIKRSFIRSLTRKKLWSGNKENIFKHLFTKDSLILWVIKTFHKNKREYSLLKDHNKKSNINFIRLKSKREQKAFYESLKLEN